MRRGDVDLRVRDLLRVEHPSDVVLLDLHLRQRHRSRITSRSGITSGSRITNGSRSAKLQYSSRPYNSGTGGGRGTIHGGPAATVALLMVGVVWHGKIML